MQIFPSLSFTYSRFWVFTIIPATKTKSSRFFYNDSKGWGLMNSTCQYWSHSGQTMGRIIFSIPCLQFYNPGECFKHMVNSIKLILGQLNTIMSYYILPIFYIKNFFFSFGLFLEILMTFLSSCIPYIYHIFFFPQVIVHTIYSVQAPFASSSN